MWMETVFAVSYASPEFTWGPKNDYHSLSRERWSPFKIMKSLPDGDKAGVSYNRSAILEKKIQNKIYRLSREECARLRENVPYVNL